MLVSTYVGKPVFCQYHSNLGQTVAYDCRPTYRAYLIFVQLWPKIAGFTASIFLPFVRFFLRLQSIPEVPSMYLGCSDGRQHVGEGSKYKRNRRKNGNYNRIFGSQIEAYITVELWIKFFNRESARLAVKMRGEGLWSPPLPTVDFVKLVTVSHTGCAEERKDTTDQIRCAMLMAESLNVAHGEQETDSSSFQLPPVERNEDILFSNIDFDEPMYESATKHRFTTCWW